MNLAFFRVVAFLAFAGTACAAIAEHPQLLKRHGVVYGVRDIDSFLNCKGTEPLDQCVAYVLTGTVVSVEYYGKAQQISGFVIRTRGGEKLMQTVLPWDLPRGAYGLIRPGRRLRIRGTFMGTRHSGNASEIVAVGSP